MIGDGGDKRQCKGANRDGVAVQTWKGDEAGVGCQVTGVRRIRVSGVGCSGDKGAREGGERQCKGANRDGVAVQK